MPIRLAEGDDLSNIALGDQGLSEVRLGNILVWSANQVPVIGTLVFAGSNFTSGSTGTINEMAGLEGGSASPNHAVSFNNVTDSDGDTLVAYRVRRPDGTYLIGGNGQTNVVNDFGLPFSGVTYDSGTQMWSGGRTSGATFTNLLNVTFRDVDSTGAVVDAETGTNSEFVDEGRWEFIVTDDRGGQGVTYLNVNLAYQQWAGSMSGGSSSLTAGATTTTNVQRTLTISETGGPRSTIQWQQSQDGGSTWSNYNTGFDSVSCSNSLTCNVEAPAFLNVRGSAAVSGWQYRAIVTGRSYSGNAGAQVTTNTQTVRTAAPYAAPTLSVGASQTRGTITAGNAGFGQTPSDPTEVSFYWVGSGVPSSGSASSLNTATATAAGNFSVPTSQLNWQDASDCGDSVTLYAFAENDVGRTPSSGFMSAGYSNTNYPTRRVTCSVPNILDGSTTAATPNTASISSNISTNNCSGSYSGNSFSRTVTYTAASGYEFAGGSNTRGISVECSYSSSSSNQTGTATSPAYSTSGLSQRLSFAVRFTDEEEDGAEWATQDVNVSCVPGETTSISNSMNVRGTTQTRHIVFASNPVRSTVNLPDIANETYTRSSDGTSLSFSADFTCADPNSEISAPRYTYETRTSTNTTTRCDVPRLQSSDGTVVQNSVGNYTISGDFTVNATATFVYGNLDFSDLVYSGGGSVIGSGSRTRNIRYSSATSGTGSLTYSGASVDSGDYGGTAVTCPSSTITESITEPQAEITSGSVSVTDTRSGSGNLFRINWTANFSIGARIEGQATRIQNIEITCGGTDHTAESRVGPSIRDGSMPTSVSDADLTTITPIPATGSSCSLTADIIPTSSCENCSGSTSVSTTFTW